MKKLTFKKDARGSLVEGVRMMYDAVCTTLGPKGRNVAIARQWGLPIIVHDGVTVAREVEAKDEFVNMGINLVREAAQKTNDEAGDGTTTSTLLAYEIVKRGMAMLEKGTNPMSLRMQINEALLVVRDELAKLSTKTTKKEDLQRVAFISSSDKEIGDLVGEAVHKVGEDGIVSVEEGYGKETTIEHTDGMMIDKGYTSAYLVTNPQRMEAVLENCLVVVTDRKITTQIELAPLVEVLAGHNKNIVVFGDISGDALRLIVHNKMRGNINALVVEPQGHGDSRREYLQDICIATGAQIISDEIGLDMKTFAEQFDLKMVGKAKQVVADKKSTVIIGGAGAKKVVEEHVANLKKLREKSESMYASEILDERIAKLTAGVTVVKVGAKTELEMRERIERVKDAIGAAKAALQEGIVPGGGIAFLRVAEHLEALDGITDGGKLLVEVLREPIRKLLVNSGEDEAGVKSYISGLPKRGPNFGYEVNSGKIVDMIKEGIIDPTKVLRLSLENAVSVATSILTTDVLIVDELEQPKADKNG